MRFSSPFEGVFARIALTVGCLVSIAAPSARAQFTWNLGTGGTWNSATNWNPTTGAPPNAAGAIAIFNGAATGSNPAQTANRTITLDAAITVGSLTFNDDLSTFTNTISTGSSGTLTFDSGGPGNATISVPAAAGTGNNTISAPMTFNSTVVANVDNTSATSAAGALNLTGTIGGAGGFVKNGDGLATFGTGAKTYTGDTVLNGGRTRISNIARPTGTSSFTINAGAQLDLIAGGTFNLGSGPLNLNGTGATTGPFAVFPGAIRNDTGLLVTVTNSVVLQSDTLIHIQATAGTGSTSNPTGSMTLSGNISGPGRLTFTAPNSNIDQGFLVLTGANTYSGGTLVAGGILQVNGTNATLGTGNVTVDNATSPSSIARLQILAGVSNAIADSATLSLAGGNAGRVDLGAGINETIAGLVLNGSTQAFGTYGSTSSGATFQNDTFFSGTGIITVAPVPEPAGILLVCGLAAGGAGWLRRRIGGKAI